MTMMVSDLSGHAYIVLYTLTYVCTQGMSQVRGVALTYGLGLHMLSLKHSGICVTCTHLAVALQNGKDYYVCGYRQSKITVVWKCSPIVPQRPLSISCIIPLSYLVLSTNSMQMAITTVDNRAQS